MENVNNILEEDSSIILTDSIISSLKTCRLLKLHESPLNNICVNNDGSLYLTSGNDSSIYIFHKTKRNNTSFSE